MSIRSGLLALLEPGPMYGYQLRAEFESRTGATWPLNIGQVYTTLQRLERDGLVEADHAAPGAESGQVVYRITDAGRTAVREWFDTPVSRTTPPRDELAIKLAVAVTLLGVDVRAIVQRQRTATVQALQDYTRLKQRAADPAGADLAWGLVLDSLVFQAEAEVRWLDHCEARLARATPSPTPQRAPGTAPAARKESSR